jgi:hypothetical protein
LDSIQEQSAREWLEQLINSNTQRRIDGVRINSVDLQKVALAV